MLLIFGMWIGFLAVCALIAFHPECPQCKEDPRVPH